MVIDGKNIAREIREGLKSDFAKLGKPVTLGFVRSGEDLLAKKFVDLKAKTARELGVQVVEFALPTDATTEDALVAVREIAEKSDAMLVQMPLSKTIDAERVLAAVPIEKDVDAMGERSRMLVLTPVVGALKEILVRNFIEGAGKKVTVVGAGKLVGAPAAAWFTQEGANVTVVTSQNGDLAASVADADIVVLGAGQEGILKKEMLKPGVAVLDAGTSESGGTIKGDADPACAEVASLFTPVPGGIGPIAIAMIFKNLLTLAKKTPLRSEV
ncbi:MAG: bifunctional 5,10-methylenetetrahydrofolate dehydrogenase/5,10-methenyltetrahydrofolate cyclohydrolase [Candidatus Adlerbacteria bacterium]|nr:bifunctional 5,10-methylenetetrahydrofolate dehydrogenase/5,10-methenyltetrahydrofolate cyclohydrolase [Candidatus Adlerbacteria bacterium]